jgi:hypothetical protein
MSTSGAGIQHLGSAIAAADDEPQQGEEDDDEWPDEPMFDDDPRVYDSGEDEGELADEQTSSDEETGDPVDTTAAAAADDDENTFGDPVRGIDSENAGVLFAWLGLARLSVLTGVDLSAGDVRRSLKGVPANLHDVAREYWASFKLTAAMPRLPSEKTSKIESAMLDWNSDDETEMGDVIDLEEGDSSLGDEQAQNSIICAHEASLT